MAGAEPLSFDQRPGALEATRGIAGAKLYAVGSRGTEGWRVQLWRAGLVLHDLSASEAIALAADLATMGGLLRDGFEPGDVSVRSGGCCDVLEGDASQGDQVLARDETSEQGHDHACAMFEFVVGQRTPAVPTGSHEGVLDSVSFPAQAAGPNSPGGGSREGGPPDDPEPVPC